MINEVYTDNEINIALMAIQKNVDAITCLDPNLIKDDRVFYPLLEMSRNNRRLLDSNILKDEGKDNFLKALITFVDEKLDDKEKKRFFLDNQIDKEKIQIFEVV